MADDVLEVHWINCTFCRGRERRQRLSFSTLNFETVFKNSTPEKKITTFVRIERGIRAAKFEAARIHLFKWRFRSSRRRFCLSSLIAGNSALLPSVVIVFAMILAGNSFIVRCHDMWPPSIITNEGARCWENISSRITKQYISICNLTLRKLVRDVQLYMFQKPFCGLYYNIFFYTVLILKT